MVFTKYVDYLDVITNVNYFSYYKGLAISKSTKNSSRYTQPSTKQNPWKLLIKAYGSHTPRLNKFLCCFDHSDQLGQHI